MSITQASISARGQADPWTLDSCSDMEHSTLQSVPTGVYVSKLWGPAIVDINDSLEESLSVDLGDVKSIQERDTTKKFQ